MIVDDFIERSNNIRDGEELVKLFEQAIGELGLTKFVYSFITEQSNLKHEAQHGVIRSYPEDWMKHYLSNDYIHFDPTYRRALSTPGVFSWKELELTSTFVPKETQVMREAEDASLLSGVSVSIHGVNQEVVGLGFAGDHKDIELNKAGMHKLHALAHQFHLAYCNIHREYPDDTTNEEIKFTGKEREVLVWCSRGKSVGTIAEIMLISEHAVKFHLQNIYKKLNVNDKTTAVLKAYRKRLIYL